MKLVNSFVKDEYYYLDYALEEFPDEDIIAHPLRLKPKTAALQKELKSSEATTMSTGKKSRKTSCTAWKESKNLKYNLTA